MKNILFLTLITLLLGFSCSHLNQYDDNPKWVINLIAEYQSEPVGNPPQSIWRYEYKGNTVYYVPPQCCDQFSILFESQGKVICAPDGGFSGRGDGRCPYFFSERTDEKLIWKDSRTR